MVSFGFGFLGFDIKKVCFVSKVLKCLFSPVFGAFLGWFIIVHLGLEGLGVFCVSCVCFSLLCCFVSVLFAL